MHRSSTPRSFASAISLLDLRPRAPPVSAKPSVPRSCSSVVIATCQPPPISPSDVLDRHLDVREEDLVELGLAGDLAQRPHLDAGRVHVDEQVRQPGVALAVRVAARDEDAPVGDVRERRPDLLAVDDEVAVVAARRVVRTAERSEPASGLGEALAPDLLGREDLREVALLLLVGAVRDDRRPGHAEPDHAEVAAAPRRAPSPRGRSPGGCTGAPRAAVLLRPGQPRVAGLVELPAPVASGLLEASARGSRR